MLPLIVLRQAGGAVAPHGRRGLLQPLLIVEPWGSIGGVAGLSTGCSPTPAEPVAAATTDAAALGNADTATAAAAALAAAAGAGTKKSWRMSRDSLPRIYAELGKARLSALVVGSTAAGFLLAGGPVSWAGLAAASIGTSLCAASANTFNQVIEVPYDAMMKRTRLRPLPGGRISKAHAAAFGAATGAAGVGLLAAATNPLVAVLGASNIVLYAGIYTPMKRVSTFNTTVGAIVGAIPPLMGWAAATGDLAAIEPWLAATVLYAWQFPHFYALAYLHRKDYAAGGYKMHPVVDATGKIPARLSLLYSGLLTAVPLAATAMDLVSPMFAVESILINGLLLNHAWGFYSDPSDKSSRKLFRTSLWYLPLLLILFVFHSKRWDEELKTDFRAACLHEVLKDTRVTVAPDSAAGLTLSTKDLCPVTAVDQAVAGTPTPVPASIVAAPTAAQ